MYMKMKNSRYYCYLLLIATVVLQSLAGLEKGVSFAKTDSVYLSTTTKVLAGDVAHAHIICPVAALCTTCSAQMRPTALRRSPAVRPVHGCNLRVRMWQTRCIPAPQRSPGGARSSLQVAQPL